MPRALKEAAKHHVLPMDDRVFQRLNTVTVGRARITRKENGMNNKVVGK